MPDLLRAQRYRDEAKRLQEKAMQAGAPQISMNLRDIARRYERLAESIELRAEE